MYLVICKIINVIQAFEQYIANATRPEGLPPFAHDLSVHYIINTFIMHF